MRILKIAILSIIIALIVTQTNVLSSFFRPKTAYAVGDLSVDWGAGITPGDPIFTISNMAPGDSTTKTVTITNNATASRPVAIKGVETQMTKNLSDVMDITISDGSTTLYGPKTLTQFFSDSLNVDGIALETLSPGEEKTITFSVTFHQSAGNEFQNADLTFNIVIGISVSIPTACQNINMTGKFPIFGTSGNDRIRGTAGNDVIFALEGNDRVDSGAGNDCIVGGLGNDRLDSGAGNDVVIGNEGDDRLLGGSGNDVVTGDAGKDNIDGGSGNDSISGGVDNDKIGGGSGTDTIHGDDGDDVIAGGSDNDVIRGDIGIDKSNGNTGRDSCSAEDMKSCEITL